MSACPNEKCGHPAEDHGAFTCWKGCGCGFGKWDLDPWGEDRPARPTFPECPTAVLVAAESETSLLRLQAESQAREIERLKGRLARVLQSVACDGRCPRPREGVWSRRRSGANPGRPAPGTPPRR
jgi:hypothetical protein